MTGPLYRIKLYGHSGQDGEWFVKQLAVVLRMTEEEAERAVQAVPVVVKEGLAKDQADRLEEILTGINALFLVEPMGEGEALPEFQAEALDSAASADADREDALKADIWMTVGVVAAGLLIVLSIVGYISSWKNFGSESTAPVTESSKDRSVLPAMDPKVKEEKIRSLRSEIGSAEVQVTRLGEQLKLILGDSPSSSDIRALKERDKRLIAVGRKLADTRIRILQLQKELQNLESR